MKLAGVFVAFLFILTGCTKKTVPVCHDCNLILISFDTLRADRLAMYGYHRRTAPNLEKLAERAVLFKNAFSPSYITLQSHMSAFTGLYPNRHKVLCSAGAPGDGMFCKDRQDTLNPAISTLPEILKQNGYRTVWYAGKPNKVMFAPKTGFLRGFDSFDPYSFMNEGDIAAILGRLEGKEKFYAFLHTWSVHSPYLVPKGEERFSQKKYTGLMPTNFSDFAASQEKCKKQGIRRCLHKLFVQNGWSAEEESQLTAGIAEPKLLGRPLQLALIRKGHEEDAQRIRDMYDNSIYYADKLLGRLIEGLGRKGLLEKTLIIVFSDHGDSHFEHSNSFGHGTFHEEVIHVPFLVFHPQLKKSLEMEKLVSLVDIFPTALNALGIASPVRDGVNALDAKEHDAVFGYVYTNRRSSAYIRSLDKKVVQTGVNFGFLDVNADPGERSPTTGIAPSPLFFQLETRLREFSSVTE